MARFERVEIEAIVSDLPIPGLCAICGEATPRWPDVSQGHCVTCALIAAELILQERKEELEWQKVPA